MPITAQIKAGQQKVTERWLFAETSSGAEIAVCLAVSVIQGGLAG